MGAVGKNDNIQSEQQNIQKTEDIKMKKNSGVKGVKFDFDWNLKYYGHKTIKKSNGSYNKFYVASNSDFTDAEEISSSE